MLDLSSEKYISKTISDFSFTHEIINEVNNLEFLNDVNIQNISTDTKYSHIYYALSAISEVLGSKLYEDILNYIDNVGNVDICKTEALQSMLTNLGISYSTFKFLDILPLDLLKLVDILSITPEYLLNQDKINNEFIKILSSEVIDTNQIDISEQLSGINSAYQKPYLNIDQLNSAISTIYLNHINSVLLSTYYDVSDKSTRIIDKTYKTYVENGHQISIRDKHYDDEIRKLKTLYRIPFSFNEILEANYIDNGTKSLEDFSEYEQEILKIEINRRFDAYNPSKLYTRCKFYKEQYVQEYINSIEQIYSIDSYLVENLQKYDIDENYMYLSSINTINLLSIDSNNEISVNNRMINDVIQQLTDITIKIREIRHTIKTQAQKNFMKGTFLFISYIINEYLKGNIVPLLKKLSSNSSVLTNYSNDTTNIELIEYIDPVNYYNISTDIDQENELEGTNVRYWEQESTMSAIIAPDNTNIFQTLPTTKSQGFAFSKEDLESFYIDTLKNSFVNTDIISQNNDDNNKYHLFKFLSSIFDIGADKTFYKDGEICCFIDDISLSSYKESLYLKYSGNQIAETPYYYHSNTIHPSYQIHPYLSTFIEAYDYSYEIENMPLLAEKTMYELLSKNLSSYIDDAGYLISVWNNPLNRNSDYLTYYEKVLHLDDDNTDNKLIGYDGLFYPDAVNELISLNITNDTEINKYIDKWYKGLNISNTYKKRISNQIKKFYNDIKKIVKDEYYDIYQYGKDIYGNIYILIKKYDDCEDFNDVKQKLESDKLDCPGALWIRFKNHPIAFPAFYFDIDNSSIKKIDELTMVNDYSNLSQIEYNSESSNTVFQWMLKINEYGIVQNQNPYPEIYDFYISTDRTSLMFYSNRVKKEDNTYSKNKTIAVTEINQIYNSNIEYERYVLRLNSIYGKQEEFQLNQNEDFKCFYSHKNSFPGYFSIDENLKMKCQYFEHNKPVKSPIVGNINIPFENNTISYDDIKVDIYNNKIDISYFIDTENTSIISYFGSETSSNITYESLSNSIDVFSKILVLHEFSIGNFSLIENKEHCCFQPFSDMGFLPLLENKILTEDTKTNTVSDSKALDLLETKGILKFQLIGDKSNDGIDFIPIIPIIRKYQSTNLIEFNDIEPKPYKTHDNLKLLSYNDVHYFENRPYIENNNKVYQPYDVKKLLSEVDNPELNIKVNESFLNEYKLDKYVQFPYLVYSENDNIPKNYISPGNNTTNKILDNNINYTFVKLTTIDTAPLSISYVYREGIGYKIDFNTPYYNNKICENVDNKYNYQHTFLNLDYPGDAGYLKTYNSGIVHARALDDFDDIAYIENVFYIKNISDDRPKFLLSTMNFVPGEYDVEVFGISSDCIFAVNIFDNNEFIALEV